MTTEDFAELKRAELAMLDVLEKIIKLLGTVGEESRDWVIDKIDE